jgi:Gpi18-like mannosyltransferase
MMRIPLTVLNRVRDTAREGFRRINWSDAAIVLFGLVLAFAIRVPLLTFRSPDFFKVRPWLSVLKDQGFSAFGTDFSTYNPPYLYQLYLVARFLPDLPNTTSIKIPSLITDFACAYIVCQIVALKYRKSIFPVLAAFAMLFAPTVVLNSAFWGQADVLYTAPLLACLYFLMVRRNNWAMIAFGIALAFKLQAIFLTPLLLALWLRGKLSWKHWLWVPLVLFLALVPSWFAGRPLPELLLLYAGQANLYLELEMQAPTVYTWMPDNGLTQRYFTLTGIIFTAVLGLLFVLLIYKSRARLTVPLLLKLALTSLLFVPFFLPRMHGRYFYPADITSIIYGFFFPQYFFVPIVIILASFFAYQPVLFGVETVPSLFVAAAIFVVLAVVARDAVVDLYAPGAEEEAAAPTTELAPEAEAANAAG